MKSTNIVFKKSEIEKIALDDFIRFLNESSYEYDKKTYPSLCAEGPYHVYSAEPGRKYIKIVVEIRGSKSVYCFIDYDANILKAASWKAPAKHKRGSLFDENYSWGKGLGPYGASYMR